MSLLIDGYNLLHVTGIFGRGRGPGSFERSRHAMLRFLVASIDESQLADAAIVFDAAEAPAGLPATIDHQGLTVHFARDYPDADTMLEEMIRRHHAPRTLVVVSSDRRIQRAARRRKAQAVKSEQWYAELLQRRRDRHAAGGVDSAKPDVAPNPAEVNYWLKEFSDFPDELPQAKKSPPGQSPASDDVTNPFPPGYGDDLLDDFDM